MDKFLIGLLAIFKTLKFFIGGSIIIFAALLLIQLISYRVFNYNIYKKLKYILIDRELHR